MAQHGCVRERVMVSPLGKTVLMSNLTQNNEMSTDTERHNYSFGLEWILYHTSVLTNANKRVVEVSFG